MNLIKSKVISSGSFLPEKIITNYDLEKSIDTTHQWIIERTGIEQRHIASENQLTSDLASKAAINAIQYVDFNPANIEMIIVATTTPDLTFPATATIVQEKIKAINAFAFDIQAVCSGFVYALSIADNFIKTGQVKNALVIGSETLSRIVDWKDRNSCVLFGDGAGALLLEANRTGDGSGIIATNLNSDGRLNDILKTSGGASKNQQTGFIEMAGKEVFKHAVEKMSKSVFSVLEQVNLKTSDIDLLIPHQANIRILNAVMQKLNLTEDKVIVTLSKHANTSAASIPLAFDFANRNKKIKNGDLIVLEALGGGLTWGSTLLKW
ncbi:MAG: ketoacyl-ACP synthase III [Rickettsiales bacterium]|nr:ketoacyl-ACP synthase III [Rickettsiales bacterium]